MLTRSEAANACLKLFQKCLHQHRRLLLSMTQTLSGQLDTSRMCTPEICATFAVLEMSERCLLSAFVCSCAALWASRMEHLLSKLLLVISGSKAEAVHDKPGSRYSRRLRKSVHLPASMVSFKDDSDASESSTSSSSSDAAEEASSSSSSSSDSADGGSEAETPAAADDGSPPGGMEAAAAAAAAAAARHDAPEREAGSPATCRQPTASEARWWQHATSR